MDLGTSTQTFEVHLDKQGVEYITGIELFGQKDQLQYILELNYQNILLPGSNFSKSVTCNAEKMCVKGKTKNTITYKKFNLTDAFTTKTFFNIGNPTKNNLQGLTKASTYIIDNPPAGLTRGVFGFGNSGALFNYIGQNFERKVGDDSFPVIVSYKVNESTLSSKNYSRKYFTGGQINIDKRVSLKGCSVAYNVKNQDNDNLFKMKSTLTYNGEKKIETALKGDIIMVVEGSLTEPMGNFFTVMGKDSYVKSLNKAICGKDVCTDEQNMKNLPTFNFKMKCDSSKDRIAHMDLKIEPSYYAYYDKQEKKIKYLIGELNNPIKGQQVMGLGRLFFSKYELFLRTGFSPSGEYSYSVGLGDIQYQVDLAFWYTVTGIVTGTLILLVLIVAFLSGRKSDKVAEADDSTFDETKTASDSEQNGWMADEEYAKV